MNFSANDIIQILTAVGSLITVAGGTWIAIKQAGIGKKVDEAKVAAAKAAQKVEESAGHRASQIEDLKKTVISQGEEVKVALKGTGNGK